MSFFSVDQTINSIAMQISKQRHYHILVVNSQEIFLEGNKELFIKIVTDLINLSTNLHSNQVTPKQIQVYLSKGLNSIYLKIQSWSTQPIFTVSNPKTIIKSTSLNSPILTDTKKQILEDFKGKLIINHEPSRGTIACLTIPLNK